MNTILKNTLLITGGIAAGLVAGILTAPKSGKETRQDLKKKIDELQSKIEGLTGEARTHIESKIKELKENLKAVESQISN